MNKIPEGIVKGRIQYHYNILNENSYILNEKEIQLHRHEIANLENCLKDIHKPIIAINHKLNKKYKVCDHCGIKLTEEYD